MFISPGTAPGEDRGFISTWHTTAISFRWRQKRVEIFHRVTKKRATLWNLLPMKIMDCRINLSHRETDNAASRSQLNGHGRNWRLLAARMMLRYMQFHEIIAAEISRFLFFFFSIQCKPTWINVSKIFFITPGLALLPERPWGPEDCRAEWVGRPTISKGRARGKCHQGNVANAKASLNGDRVFPNGLSGRVQGPAAPARCLTEV